MISVSIAMATYNGEKHIRRQLDSLSLQSHLPSELVITDDCSEDSTIAIIDEFAKTASFPVNIYRNESRLGFRANFMRAASLCQSELISFCDQDDYWYPQKIAVSVKPFNDPEVLLTYHNADVVTGEGKRIGSLAASVGQAWSPWLPVLGFTEVFRRSLLRLSDLWPSSLDKSAGSRPSAHDQWFFFLASVFGKTSYLEEPLVAYVQHKNNAVGWKKRQLAEMVRNRADEVSVYAEAAESRAAILKMVATYDLEGAWKERATEAADYYLGLSHLFALRSTLHTAANFYDRLEAFRAIFAQSRYSDAWGLGRNAFIVDALLGVLIGPHRRPISG
jgi:glycosyltransferase involved in cell wall biosynthesis